MNTTLAARRLSFVLDAPTGAAPSRIQIAKVGSFTDQRYGAFSIAPADVAEWQANLAKLPGGMALIDCDHSADKPGAARDTKAAGWITGIDLEDGVPMADVEWTPLGEQAIRDRVYAFFSPVYGPYTDETGATTANVLQGGALSNKPFLDMPTISLSRAPETPGLLLDHELDVATRELSAAQVAGTGDTGELVRFLHALDAKMGRAPREFPTSPAANAGPGGGGKPEPGPLDVPWSELVPDRVKLDRVARAVAAEAGVNYIDGMNMVERGHALGDVRTALRVGGADPAAVDRRVRKMEAEAAKVRQLAADVAGPAGRVDQHGNVLLAPTADRGKLLTDPAAFENDFLCVQAQGQYVLNGDHDREGFRGARDAAIRAGVDLPATIERQAAVGRARQQAYEDAAAATAPKTPAEVAARMGLVPVNSPTNLF